MNTFVPLEPNAGRLCNALRSGHITPPAAITDIMDNAVTHKATRVVVQIEREQKVSDARKDNVKAYLVIDNGAGMNEEKLLNALSLGSSPDDYGSNSLSKFGLGLKSASFSQGEVLEIVSSDGTGPFLKYRVSLPEVRDRGYGAETVALSPDDEALIAEHLSEGHGTIVRIAEIRKGNHPSIRSTVDELQQRTGIIYYYFMLDESLEIEVDGKKCEPFDVLCTQEAERNGNLDENDWNGRETRWIEKPSVVVLDGANNIAAQVEVTQLPHPPTFEADGPGQRAKIRDRYHIEGGNYGFYVYRNKRLISWAERFAGMNNSIVPLDQDYYSFRGRIQIDSGADDALNIDVKKSQIHLSDEAFNALNDFALDCRRKSKKAWQFRGAEIKRLSGLDSTGTANRLALEVEAPEELPGSPDTEESFAERQERERQIVEEQEKIFEIEARQSALESGEGVPAEAGSEEFEAALFRAVAGEEAGPSDKIFKVRSIEDHALWEPYYDPDKKNCVRINQVHHFARKIYQDNKDNGDLKILFDLMLLQLATAEVYVEKNLQKYKRADITAILQEYRRVSSEYLAQMCRDLGDKLPHSD